MFHLSLPCRNLDQMKAFYASIPGVRIGRNQNHWFDVDLFGNQITFVESDYDFKHGNYRFEEEIIPSFHFGVILDREQWDSLFTYFSKTNPELQYHKYLLGRTGEHQSFFIDDPSNFTLEFKCFSSHSDIFKV